MKLLCPMVLEKMHLQESALFELDHTNVTMYPPHHAIYAPAGFEVTLSKGLGGYAFTRKTLLDLIFWVKVA